MMNANDDELDNELEASDVFNLCKDCYTEENIKAHADICKNFCGFYMKPTTY
jgi:hypothetical protein